MNQAEIITVALIQTRCDDSFDHNLLNACNRIRESKELGAHIACLPELFLSPYPCQQEDHDQFKLAEPVDGPTIGRLQELARQLEMTLVCGSIFEQRAAGVYHNTSVVLDCDGSRVGQYRKMHIPDDPLYYEKFYFAPGDQGFQSFATSHGSVGVGICWDQWFPEAARLTAMAGAELICYPTAIGWIPGDKQDHGPAQIDAWVTVMRGHAIANGCYIAAVNRVGMEGQLEFWGSSVAIDPYGEVLVQASVADTEIALFEFDRSRIDAARTHWPFWRDRRIDAYDGLVRRWGDA